MSSGRAEAKLLNLKVRLLHIRTRPGLKVLLDDRVLDRVCSRLVGYLPIFKLVVLPLDELEDYMRKRDVIHGGYEVLDYWTVSHEGVGLFAYVLLAKPNLTAKLRALLLEDEPQLIKT